LYRLILEVLLGVEVKGDRLRLAPRLPARALPCRIRYRYRETVYHLELCPPQTSDPGPAVVTLDGKEQPNGDVPLCDDGKEHRMVWRWR
jgi:cellobiose phosphorylase